MLFFFRLARKHGGGARGLEAIEALHAAGELGERQLLSHDELKAVSAKARVQIRTGECRPYSNIALIAGVTF